MAPTNGKNVARIAAITLLTFGCLFVMAPFMSAILFAACVVISSWPMYQRLLGRMQQRRTLAASTMTLTLTLLVLIPIALVGYHLGENIARLFDQLRSVIDSGEVAPPAWIRNIPMVGIQVDDYLRELIGSREQMMALGRRLLEPGRHYLAISGMVLGTGIAQMALAAFVAFFFYRDGMTLLRAITVVMGRVMGETGPHILRTVSQTVRGVMYGLLGTALAQALVAAVGFVIAGVPAVPLLSVMVFVLSLVPVGPPLVWGGAALWLFSHGENGWGIFMVIWGTVLISGVDNVVKPMLISRGSSLPFLLTLLGVLGGVLAFGFVGIFIGPTLLAVGYSLLSEWTGGGDEIALPSDRASNLD
ncbi:AI-2E family transporter [Massilia sp. S19_KUP03_FR1]|uniref:AI-2E family transporter n=1 Tax=Massilia sp. S19_KUP03_FR1 TaxID=3025503 RepID=UPI002FCD5166